MTCANLNPGDYCEEIKGKITASQIKIWKRADIFPGGAESKYVDYWKRKADSSYIPTKQKPVSPKHLGDFVESALDKIGAARVVNKVHAWLGIPCGCKKRKEKLNQLHRWATRVIQGKEGKAEQYLNELVEEDKEED
jgi:hypothetical protein